LRCSQCLPSSMTHCVAGSGTQSRSVSRTSVSVIVSDCFFREKFRVLHELLVSWRLRQANGIASCGQSHKKKLSSLNRWQTRRRRSYRAFGFLFFLNRVSSDFWDTLYLKLSYDHSLSLNL
jgi:hypothetical protein